MRTAFAVLARIGVADTLGQRRGGKSGEHRSQQERRDESDHRLLANFVACYHGRTRLWPVPCVAGEARSRVREGLISSYSPVRRIPERSHHMHRRSFLKTLAAGAGASVLRPRLSEAALPKAKITKVNIYEPPNPNRLFNQSNMLVTVETDAGLTGIGEGGARDTLEQCAGTLIGKNPFKIEAIWQEMYMAWFYPPGREKIHALGALDVALWDIKGKVLGVPVHEILGGAVRNYCECYATGGVPVPGAKPGERPPLKERARAAIEA